MHHVQVVQGRRGRRLVDGEREGEPLLREVGVYPAALGPVSRVTIRVFLGKVVSLVVVALDVPIEMWILVAGLVQETENIFEPLCLIVERRPNFRAGQSGNKVDETKTCDRTSQARVLVII